LQPAIGSSFCALQSPESFGSLAGCRRNLRLTDSPRILRLLGSEGGLIAPARSAWSPLQPAAGIAETWTPLLGLLQPGRGAVCPDQLAECHFERSGGK